MSTNYQKMFIFVTIVLLGLTLVACSSAGPDQSQNKPIIFADAGWDSIQFHNAVAGFVIEQGFGYPTEVMVGTTPVTFTGLRRGDIDAYMEVWTENLYEDYTDALSKGDIVELAVNFDDNAQGLYVPTFVIKGDPIRGIEPMAPDLKSVFDLPKYKELFKDPETPGKGRIYGSPPGWQVDEILSVKVQTYGLDQDYNYFRPGSDTALATSIARAFERGEPWVGYYWEPTWIMGLYDMTLLEEPPYTDEAWNNGYNAEFPPVRVTVAVNKNLPDRAPEVVEFLKNYTTSSAVTSEALAYMIEHDATAQEAAIHFLRENQDLWTQWVPEGIAQKVKAAL